MKAKVLIVDDEWNMRNLLRIYLSKEGFEVIEASSGAEALTRAANEQPAIILLDLMMPDMDGREVCRRIREKHGTPVLMLTARTETRDKVEGLELGADDYVTKPFDSDELIARIHALLRRSAPVHHIEKITFPEMVILAEGRQLLVQDQPVELTPKEFDLFVLLAQNPHRAYSREVMLDTLWGHDYLGEQRAVDTHIKNIREKMQRAGLSYNPIQTIWGVGYKFHIPETVT